MIFILLEIALFGLIAAKADYDLVEFITKKESKYYFNMEVNEFCFKKLGYDVVSIINEKLGEAAPLFQQEIEKIRSLIAGYLILDYEGFEAGTKGIDLKSIKIGSEKILQARQFMGLDAQTEVVKNEEIDIESIGIGQLDKAKVVQGLQMVGIDLQQLPDGVDLNSNAIDLQQILNLLKGKEIDLSAIKRFAEVTGIHPQIIENALARNGISAREARVASAGMESAAIESEAIGSGDNELGRIETAGMESAGIQSGAIESEGTNEMDLEFILQWMEKMGKIDLQSIGVNLKDISNSQKLMNEKYGNIIDNYDPNGEGNNDIIEKVKYYLSIYGALINWGTIVCIGSFGLSVLCLFCDKGGKLFVVIVLIIKVVTVCIPVGLKFGAPYIQNDGREMINCVEIGDWCIVDCCVLLICLFLLFCKWK